MEESGDCEGCDLFPFFWVMRLEQLDYVVALCECEVGCCVFFDGDLFQVFFEGFEFGFVYALWCYSAQVVAGYFLGSAFGGVVFAGYFVEVVASVYVFDFSAGGFVFLDPFGKSHELPI